MAISQHLSSYLKESGVRYEVCTHAPSRSSAETARLANLMAGQIAKAVVLEDDDGYVMAVVPADKRVVVGELARMLDRPRLHLCDEADVARLFKDCEPGAVPAVGMPWGMETVVDEELESNGEVYIEAGDHQRLLRMSHDDFHTLMRAQRHGHFCKEALH
jgi:Ala-tRNA(Pro) deacylase